MLHGRREAARAETPHVMDVHAVYWLTNATNGNVINSFAVLAQVI